MNLPGELINEILQYLSFEEIRICYKTDQRFHVLSKSSIRKYLGFRFWCTITIFDRWRKSCFYEAHPDMIEGLIMEKRKGYVDKKVKVRRSRSGEEIEIVGLDPKKPFLWKWKDIPTAIREVISDHCAWKKPKYVMCTPSVFRECTSSGQEITIKAIDWIEMFRYKKKYFPDGSWRPNCRSPIKKSLFKNCLDLTKEDIEEAGLIGEHYPSFERAKMLELKSGQVIYYSYNLISGLNNTNLYKTAIYNVKLLG